jgi:hypothetical protein
MAVPAGGESASAKAAQNASSIAVPKPAMAHRLNHLFDNDPFMTSADRSRSESLLGRGSVSLSHRKQMPASKPVI